MKIQTGDPTGFHRDGNNHVERNINANIKILKTAVTAEPVLAKNQFYMRLLPSKSVAVDGIPDRCAGRIVISRNFGTFNIPCLGKTVLVEVKDASQCMII